MKPNCDNGCLHYHGGECIKYTGSPILSPKIEQHTDFNTVVQILANNGGTTTPSSCYTQLTFEELSQLVTINGLKRGCWYLLTDFQTSNEIINITITEDRADKTNTGILNKAPIEPLLLMLLSEEEALFTGYAPNGDQILYTPYHASEALSGAEKGCILRRIDLYRNINLPLDWRNIKWQINGVPYNTFNGTNGSPENFTQQSRNIYIGGGGIYNRPTTIIFTTNYPVIYDIRINAGEMFIIQEARSIEVAYTNVALPNAVLENIKSGGLSKHSVSDISTYENQYNPTFDLR